MNDVIIEVSRKTGTAEKYVDTLGKQNQNLQNKLKFKFKDETVEGIAWLEYEIDNVKKYALMDRYEEGYQIDIKSCLLISNHVKIDIKITEEETPEGIPIFVSNPVTFRVIETINAEEEEPDEYPIWLDSVNAKLLEIDNEEKVRDENENIRIENETQRENYINDLKERVDNGEFKGKDGLTTSISLDGETYTQENGVITLPSYPQKTSDLVNDSDFVTKSYVGDISTILSTLTTVSEASE